MKGSKELKILAGEILGSIVFLTMLYGSVVQFILGRESFYVIIARGRKKKFKKNSKLQ